MDILAESEAMGRASWYALFEGERQEYVVGFQGEHAARPAMDLLRAFRSANVPCRRTAVSDTGPAHELSAQARASVRRWPR